MAFNRFQIGQIPQTENRSLFHLTILILKFFGFSSFLVLDFTIRLILNLLSQNPLSS
jgi:hypothetical protein